MNDLQKYAQTLSTATLQRKIKDLNTEADTLEYGGHPVDGIENEIRIMEEELESR